MSGGGLGGILKAAAPVALGLAFPELAPALAGGLGLTGTAGSVIANGLIGGATSGLLGAVTGSKNPLKDALIGAGTGAAGGFLGGSTSNPLDAANGAAGNDVTAQFANGLGDSGSNALGQAVNAGGGIPGSASYLPQGFGNSMQLANVGAQAAPAAVQSAATASPSTLSQIGHYITDHPVPAALIGATGLTALQALQPQQKIKTPNSGYSDALPQYHVESTQTPYQGDWYTYGMQPQAPMINSNVRPGPAQTYAKGGTVNPLEFSADGKVPDTGMGGHADDVSAKLSGGEYVLPADVVSALGDGATDSGGKKLDTMVSNVRKHKATKKFPPKAKNPLSYVGA